MGAHFPLQLRGSQGGGMGSPGFLNRGQPLAADAVFGSLCFGQQGRKAPSLWEVAGLAQGCLGNRVQCLAAMGIQKLRAWQLCQLPGKGGHCPILTGANRAFPPLLLGAQWPPCSQSTPGPRGAHLRPLTPSSEGERLGGVGWNFWLSFKRSSGEEALWIQNHPQSYKMA